MRTTISIDEALLREAEDKARQLGKSFSSLVEDALRDTIGNTTTATPSPPPMDEAAALEDSDPFFRALEEVREIGRITSASHLRQAE